MNGSLSDRRDFSADWLAIRSLATRELIRFFRQRTRLVGALIQPILFWVLFGAGLRGSFQPPAWAPANMSYQEFFFPGVAVMIVMFTAIFSTISIIEDRREGFLQGVLVSPVSRLSLVLGKICGGSLLAIFQAGLFLLIAPWMGLSFTAFSWMSMMVYLTLIAFALTGLGFLIAWPLDSTQGFHAVMSIFLMPLWLLSGSFFPVGDKGWLSWIMVFNPLTYGVAGLRRILYWQHPLPAGPGFPSLFVCVPVMLLFAAGCVGGSVWLASRSSVHNVR